MPPTAEERRERANNPPVYVSKPKPWEIESEPQQTRLLKVRQKKAARLAMRAQERGASTLARVDALKAKGYKFRTATADEVRFMKTQFPDWKKKLTWKGDRILVKGKRIATKTGSSIKSLGKSAGSKALSGGKYVIKKAPSAIGRRAKMIKRF